MRIGVCYYPEQWPEEQWSRDAAMMTGAGIAVVRIGEFAWAAYEPSRDNFQWEWLDRAIATLADAGLEIVLGTPSATPPIWLAEELPEIMAEDVAGRRRPYGTRRHTCPTSAAYRSEVHRVVTLLAERYAGNSAVTAWQIDNEPGNHDSARCWCEECEAGFVEWLQDRYETIDDLNRAWGTIFWSQVYPRFESVRLPRPAPTSHSPSLLLAHQRFVSRQVVSGLEEQAEAIRAVKPDVDLMTNWYAGDTFVDYQAVARIGGIGAIDSYPHGVADPNEVRFWHDLARGAGGTGRGWIMEQQPGPINWTPTNPPVAPGEVAQWLSDAARDGIKTTLLFRWRAALAGQETYHSGLLTHSGDATAGLEEVATFVSPEPVGSAATALIYSYADAWLFAIEPHLEGLTHRQLVVTAHAAARRTGPVDVIGWEDALEPYSTVIVPAALIATPQRASMLLEAAAAGATVIVGPRSFTRTPDATALAQSVPLHVADAIGIRVHEGRSLPTPSALESGATAGPWQDVFVVESGMMLDRTVQREPVIAVTGHGAGRVVMMGASSHDAWVALLERLAAPH